MNRKLFIMPLALSILLSACGEKKSSVDLTAPPTKDIPVIEVTTEEEEPKESILDKEVDVIFSMYTLDDMTIEEYVANLQEENPGTKYEVYDDSHYSTTIKDSERKRILEEIKSEGGIDESLKSIFSDEQYNGAFLNVEYDDLFQNVDYYVDKTAYDNAGIAVALGPIFVSGMLSDSIQAYSLISPEDRHTALKILDNETKEVIYDSSAEVE